MSITPIYSTTATATGGRDGKVTVADSDLNLALAMPKALGGSGQGNNPEQLFAAGYSACFIGALKFVAGRDGIDISVDPAVRATVGIGPIPDGFGIEVDLEVALPGMEKDAARDLMERAHKVCPYSNATKGNIDIETTLV